MYSAAAVAPPQEDTLGGVVTDVAGMGLCRVMVLLFLERVVASLSPEALAAADAAGGDADADADADADGGQSSFNGDGDDDVRLVAMLRQLVRELIALNLSPGESERVVGVVGLVL